VQQLKKQPHEEYILPRIFIDGLCAMAGTWQNGMGKKQCIKAWEGLQISIDAC
jgi:hypothetical protein